MLCNAHVHVGLTQCSDGNMFRLAKTMGRILHPTRWYTQAGNIGKHKPVHWFSKNLPKGASSMVCGKLYL